VTSPHKDLDNSDYLKTQTWQEGEEENKTLEARNSNVILRSKNWSALPSKVK
jgi:hypothetical protein